MNRIIFCALIFLQSCSISTPKKGEKIGHIVKLAEEGFFCKTWEGELIRGGLNDGSGSFGQVFKFTIEDKQSFIVAKKALENNLEVIVHYKSEFIASLFRSECMAPHFVDYIVIKEEECKE